MSNLVRLKKLHKLNNNTHIPIYKDTLFVLQIHIKKAITISIFKIDDICTDPDTTIIVKDKVHVEYSSKMFTEQEISDAVKHLENWLIK